MDKKIFIASDHAGYSLKQNLINKFSNQFVNLGTQSEESVDYPDFAHALTKKINSFPGSLGILICGSGVGMSIAANRDPNIRAGLVHNAELAKLINLGTESEESVDYPDFAHSLIKKINSFPGSLGILICGSGVGMSIAANRDPNIRAGLVHNAELAKLIKQHNDANVLVLPGRFIDVHEAIKCVEIFLNTEFESGRHKKRIDKI